VLLIIGLIILGFILVDFFARKEVIDKILGELEWDDMWYDYIEDELRAELNTWIFLSSMKFSAPFILVGLLFIIGSEKLRLMKFSK